MTVQPERDTGNGSDAIAQARREVQEQVNQAGADQQAKKQLFEQLVQQLANKDATAEEVRLQVAARDGAVPDEKRREARSTTTSVVKIFETVRQIAQGRIPREAAPRLSDKSFTLLKNLDEKIGDRITDSSAAFVYPLVQRALESEISAAEVTDLFNGLKRNLINYNSTIVRGVADALIKTAREGKLNIDPATAEQRFKVEDAISEVRERQEYRQQRYVQEHSPFVELSAVEKKELEELGNKLARTDQVTYDRREQIKNNCFKGALNDGDKVDLTRIGFSEAEINRYQDLMKKAKEYYASPSARREYEQHFTQDDQKLFSYQYLWDHGLLTPNGFTDEGKRLLKRTVLKAVNSLMAKVDSAPDSDFQQNYSELHEGYTYRFIQDTIVALKNSDQLLGEFAGMTNEAKQKVIDFIDNGLLGELGREREMKELFHNLAIYIKTMGPEELTKYMSRYNVSRVVSVATDDFSGKLVSLAMSEYERYMKYDIAMNGGKVRPSLFAGRVDPNKLYYDVEDRTILLNRLRETWDGLRRNARTLPDNVKLDYRKIEFKKDDLACLEKAEEWEIKRALKYAMGIHMTQTIRVPEIIASTRPPVGYQGSADNIFDLAAQLNPSWKWRLGRGAEAQRETHVPEVLIAEGLVKRPERSLLKRLFLRWNPRKIHSEVQKYAKFEMSEKWAHIKDAWLYKDMDYRRLIKLFGLGGLATRNGWRLVGFKEGTFNKQVSKIKLLIENNVMQKGGEAFKFSDNWIRTYEQLAGVVGVGARFFYDAERAKDFVQAELWKNLGLTDEIAAGKIGQEKLDEYWFEYTEGKLGDKAMFDTPDGDKMTVMEYLEAKTLVFRGLNFYDLLQRSPMDFLNNLVNITPELLSEKLGGVHDLYFEFDEKELSTKLRARLQEKGRIKDYTTEWQKILEFQRDQNRIWGKENFKHLKFVRGFYQKLEDWAFNLKDSQGNYVYRKEDGLDKKAVLELFFRTMDLAIEKVKLRNAVTMNPEDIEHPEIRKLIFNEGAKDEDKGLVTYFRGLNEDFGVRKARDQDGILTGSDEKLGAKGFFYHMARGWFNELGHSLHPDTSDMDWRFVLHNIGSEAGENMVKRLWGDLDFWNKTMNQLSDLDHMLIRAAKSHSMEEIMKLHTGIHQLEGIAGKSAIYEAQYYLSQVVARYFQEHHLARMPFLLGAVVSPIIGADLSLSKIYGGRAAMSMTTDGINAYFQELTHMGYIQHEGTFGFDRLAKSLGADWEKLVVGEIIPNIATALILFILWKYISGALKESTGGGAGGGGGGGHR